MKLKYSDSRFSSYEPEDIKELNKLLENDEQFRKGLERLDKAFEKNIYNDISYERGLRGVKDHENGDKTFYITYTAYLG